jgi:hypothetical protein
MTTRQMLNEWIAHMQPILGSPPELPEQSGIVALDCGDGLAVHIGAFDANDMVHFFATLTVAPESHDEMHLLMKEALRVNVELLGILPGGVGLSPDEREFVLSAHYPLTTLDVDSLSSRLAGFVTICKETKERFLQPGLPSSTISLAAYTQQV